MRLGVTAALFVLLAGLPQVCAADPWLLSFATFLGGSDLTAATSVAVDGAGNVYVAGWTDSPGLAGCIPVRGGGGGVDAFVAKWDHATQLLSYCTFLGGRGDDRAFAVAADGAGNAYVTGWTMSTDFPVSGALQTSLAGAKNAFVTKINATGAIVYSTYLGGSGYDSGNTIAVDGQGGVTIAGDTASPNFPTSHPLQSKLNGQANVFVARLNPSGNSLTYSTYLGGSGSDHGAAVALDAAGAAYVTGSTTSPNFPVVNAFQAASGGSQDAFAAKISSSGAALVYSTYLGGSGGTAGFPEAGSAIAVDGAGSAYIAGTTSSPNFPLANPLLSALGGVGIHAFVAKLTPLGNGLVYSTYLGGSSIDQASAIAVDSGGNSAIAGYSASQDFPLAGGVQPYLAGSYDAFITRLDSTGTVLLASTFLGGSGSDAANAVAIDSAGTVYVAGQTQSPDFPLKNATQSGFSGVQDAFLAVLGSTVPLPAPPPAPTGLTATSSAASVVPVTNASFESPSCPTGTCTPAGWTLAHAGIWTPPAGIFTSIPDGSQVAWANAAASITQTLSTTLALNTTYTLTVNAGARSGDPFAPVIRLYAGATLLGTASGATPSAGNWAVWTLVYDSGVANAAVGQPLTVSLGSSVTQTNFDAVSLTAAPDTGPGGASVALSWSACSGASSYNVYRGTAAGGEGATAIATGITATAYADTGLTSGTRYYYKVAGVNTGGAGPLSAEVSAVAGP